MDKPMVTAKFTPKIGTLMPLAKWVKHVEQGYLTDYDGFGHYATEYHETDAVASPSDVKHHRVRTEFPFVVWYNR